jgi:hypothetical protein
VGIIHKTNQSSKTSRYLSLLTSISYLVGSILFIPTNQNMAISGIQIFIFASGVELLTQIFNMYKLGLTDETDRESEVTQSYSNHYIKALVICISEFYGGTLFLSGSVTLLLHINNTLGMSLYLGGTIAYLVAASLSLVDKLVKEWQR